MFMDSDLKHESKQAHKSAFADLRKEVYENQSVPTSILTSIGNVDYMFNLVSVDIKKGVFVYNYFGSAVGF